ncbi:MAG: alpha/beta hydrolase [Deltaproteobacteria bacterium]|nr:alpha/beta hydrolase [Deltaproteobacteria bacterium]
MSVQTGFIKGRDQTQIYYNLQGIGNPLVFSYGVTCGVYHFKYQFKYFKDQYQILQYDYRGHHNSEMPQKFENLNIEECAYDLKAILDTLKIEKATLVGHSMGVAVNLKFYDLFPERVKALVLVCGGIRNPFDIMFYTDLTKVFFEATKWGYLNYPEPLTKIWKNIPLSLTHQVISLLGYNKLLSDKNDIMQYVEGMKSHPIETLLYFLQDYSKFNGKNICEKTICPTLIIGGQADLITPIAHVRKIHSFIKGSELFIVPHGSHVSQVDMPEVVNLRIEKFLNSLS